MTCRQRRGHVCSFPHTHACSFISLQPGLKWVKKIVTLSESRLSPITLFTYPLLSAKETSGPVLKFTELLWKDHRTGKPSKRSFDSKFRTYICVHFANSLNHPKQRYVYKKFFFKQSAHFVRCIFSINRLNYFSAATHYLKTSEGDMPVSTNNCHNHKKLKITSLSGTGIQMRCQTAYI